MDKAPHGAQHIKDILTGSILWVEWKTVVLVAAVYAAVGLFHFLFRRRFLLISENAAAARAEGVNVGLWDFLFYLTFGFVITASVGSAGVLLVFVFLVAPAVMAVLVTDRLLHQLLFGWGVGIVVTVAGLTASLLADLSSGPLVIGTYAIALILVSAVVYVIRSGDRRGACRRTLAIALAFAACFALLLLLGRAVGGRYRGHAHGHGHHGEAAAGEVGAHDPAGEEHPRAAGEGASGEPAARFEASDDPAERADIVCGALSAVPGDGTALALRYLAGDPPLFFAQTVVDALDAALGEPSGYDVGRSYTSPENQAAVARIQADLEPR